MIKTYTHIPTPGDHYSPATGSAIMTIIYELTRQHTLAGGKSHIIVGENTIHDYPIEQCTEVSFRTLQNSREKLSDSITGYIGLPRFFANQVYKPVTASMDRDYDGCLFVWNEPGCVQQMRKAFPKAKICLYAQNWLFRTYSKRELNTVLDSLNWVICCSQFIAEQTGDLAGHATATDKIVGIVNGVDTDKFRPGVTESNDHEPTILFVGRVQPFKGPDLILRAAQKIYNNNRHFKVKIVGSSNFNAHEKLTPYELELRKLAGPISDIVEFQPFVDREGIVGEYQKAQIACVPSTWNEPCSLTVSESMAVGVATVAARKGGIPEVGGDAVMYFDPTDVNELADLLAQLVDDPSARKTWGAKGRLRAEQISWRNQYTQVNSIVGA